MPKRAKSRPARPVPVQLPLFAEAASLARIRPERNEWRFYRMEVWPDLFGRALLLRQWGRIGTEGRRRLDPHPDPGAALNALAQLARQKRRRGYQDRAARPGARHPQAAGVEAFSKGIALNMVQKWLGHAQLTTTAIYADAVGEEEQSIAARMW
jgi:predicted DNA-binding WGR domain protein